MTIGEKIKQKRLECGLSQSELGRRCGFSYVMLSQYERGIRTPKMSSLAKISKELGVDPPYFLDTDMASRTLIGNIVGVEYEELEKYAAALDIDILSLIGLGVKQTLEVCKAKLENRDPQIFNTELAEANRIMHPDKRANSPKSTTCSECHNAL